ncbi:unnamed protein product [Symbiodinium sp. CCMP2592]|nr:unnamed protein product [Symbiodinium sp. CCMP2592]
MPRRQQAKPVKKVKKKRATGKPVKKVKKPWNKDRKQTVADSSNVFIEYEDLQLFWACLLFCCGPVYLAAVWLTMCTSRRISEILRVRGRDFHLDGGGFCDDPHVLVKERPQDKKKPGLGKIRGKVAIARLSKTTISTIRTILAEGLPWACWPILEKYQSSHGEMFAKNKPTTKKTFQPGALEKDSLWFPALRTSKTSWMSRQSCWNAVAKTREFMYGLTGKRCFNPDAIFNGSHTTLHGATRHTAATLLLFNPGAVQQEPPSEAAVLNVQQRVDVSTFRRHYTHCRVSQVRKAVEYAAVPLKEMPSAGADNGHCEDSQEVSREAASSSSSAQLPATAKRGAPPAEQVHDDEVHEDAVHEDAEEPAAHQPGAAKKCSRNAWRKVQRRAGKKKHDEKFHFFL